MFVLFTITWTRSSLSEPSASRTWSPEWSPHLLTLKADRTMTALPANVSVCRSTAALLQMPDSLLNLTAAVQAASGQPLPPLCTRCCCGFLNRFLTVAFMVSLAFAIVVGNVITLTVFVQTRQSRTPQGYLKGECARHFPTMSLFLSLNMSSLP